MGNLLIALGAAAMLGGLAWLGYVGSVMKGSRGNALVGGISSVVVGLAVVVLASSVTGDDDPLQQLVPDGSGFATATPEVLPTATPLPEPKDLYRLEASTLAASAGRDLARVIQLLSAPATEDAIWENDVRQTASQFIRLPLRLDNLAPTEEQLGTHDLLVSVLADLSGAGRKINDSLDAMKFDNDTFAIRSLGEALVTLRDSSDVIVEIISQTVEDTE